MERSLYSIARFRQRIFALIPRGFWPGFLIGFVYFSIIFQWLWEPYPLDHLGITSRLLAFVIVGLMGLGSAFSMAMGWGLLGMYAHRLRIQRRLTPLTLASGFVLAEWLRSWFFGFMWYGNGSIIGPYWTFGNIAYWFSGNDMIRRTSAWWGIYGIEFLLVLFVCAFFVGWRRQKFFALILAGLPVLLFVSWPAPLVPDQEDEQVPVVILQTKTPADLVLSPDEQLSHLQKKLELVRAAAQFTASGSFVVFPEGADFTRQIGTFLNPGAVASYFQNTFEKEVFFFDNVRVGQDDSAHSRTIALSSKNGGLNSYDKKLLSPWGEYLPYVVSLPARLFIPDFEQKFSRLRALSPGTQSNSIYTPGGQAKISVCSEIVSPKLTRKNISDLLIAQNSIGALGASRWVDYQVLQWARFRAAENDKYLLMASNFGRSYVLDRTGNIQSITHAPGYEILTGTIVLNAQSTWYNTLGDWPILTLSLFIAGWSLLKKPGDDPKS